ncbi:MAG: NADPH-dependent F420 reductase [Anaerolineae bacterium CFX3]|jgi:NADPH-dependent F420 reductase|nr:NADPH-dependent F420 reductase [Anaerolineales bacterium]MCE7904850.1 NADPH-dependent F420 reductase [Anaerolineae bacterium CFX3]MCQ3945786.1 NADPH-dependent F420 reductase [Anaerolineae bacterium]GER81179.1 NADPH-dependent F420 reductase [Candidatus Denitrolinea symbiosum]MCZ7549136.1 NADPH-dependent F420 reductase [Anaerolineales bacterium]
MTNSPILLTVAVLGGTGKEGKGLAYRWAKAGYHVHIGSREAAKAEAAASELMDRLQGEAFIQGMSNFDAARQADIVVLTVPYAAHRSTLEAVKDAVKGKILIDVTVPLVPPKVATVQMPKAGSAAQEAREILGADAQVCAAFQNVSHEHLLTDADVECDVLVTGTSKEARAETLKLVEAAGLTGWDAGPLENSVVVEGLTSVLIGINKKYGSAHAGIKITGAERK